MWDRYKRTAPAVQTAILIAVIVIYFASGRQWVAALAFLVAMELGAIAGAWWGERLASRVRARQDSLPLERRQK